MRLHYIGRDRRIVFVMFCILFAFVLSVLLILLINTKTDAKDYSYIYRSIRIEDGDTLDSIAGRFISESGMTRHSDFVREISRVNRLSSDTIISGAYLVIPVLDTQTSY